MISAILSGFHVLTNVCVWVCMCAQQQLFIDMFGTHDNLLWDIIFYIYQYFRFKFQYDM